MKKFAEIFTTPFIIIIIVPILLVLCVGYLFFIPFDIIRYHKMPYYKNLKIKYRFFQTSSDDVKLYNRIVRENLPIEYCNNDDFEYFIKDGHVLLNGYGHEGFDEVNGEWCFVLDGECTTEMSMKKALEYETEMLKLEHRCLPVKFLFFHNNDSEVLERVKECPYLHCVSSIDDDI